MCTKTIYTTIAKHHSESIVAAVPTLLLVFVRFIVSDSNKMRVCGVEASWKKEIRGKKTFEFILETNVRNREHK